jgi:hypothetical protein
VSLFGLIMIVLVAFSGCQHVSASSPHKIQFVNQADSKKVLELTVHEPNMLGRAHMAVFGGRVKGGYSLKEGDKTTEGSVTQLEDSYRLTSKDGKEQRFDVDRATGSLKDESGAVWKLDNPSPTATLKEW